MSFDLAFAQLGTDHTDTSTQVHKQTCTKIFIREVLAIAQKWKQSKCHQLHVKQ